jgi:tRNA threonylcarbamoyladenosine biosynthesis protein TsaB
MVLLAIETVTRRGSLAVFDGGECHARDGGAEGTHAERLPGEALALLADHGRSLADVDRFVVVAGPGSFTGLRVGLAVVQGFALVGDRRVAPVTTLDVIAESWRLEHGPSLGRRETFLAACLDGQRGEIFYAAWTLRVDEPIEAARQVIEPSVGTPGEAVARWREAAGGDAALAGINMQPHAAALAALGWRLDAVSAPLAGAAAAIAARQPDLAVAPHALRPLYIRRPDVVIARERAGLTPR